MWSGHIYSRLYREGGRVFFFWQFEIPGTIKNFHCPRGIVQIEVRMIFCDYVYFGVDDTDLQVDFPLKAVTRLHQTKKPAAVNRKRQGVRLLLSLYPPCCKCNGICTNKRTNKPREPAFLTLVALHRLRTFIFPVWMGGLVG